MAIAIWSGCTLKNMPLVLITVTLIPHLIYILLAGFYFLKIGKVRAYFRAKRDALKSIRKLIAKRKLIQQHRRVGQMYLWQLFAIKNQLARLTARKPNG